MCSVGFCPGEMEAEPASVVDDEFGECDTVAVGWVEGLVEDVAAGVFDWLETHFVEGSVE